jgi:dihydroorotase
MTLTIKGAYVYGYAGGEGYYDVTVEDGKVREIGENLGGSGVVIDARGLSLLPGLVDIHCHLRDPGQEYKEDIRTGTRSAAKGGFTAVACMPNTSPVNDNAAITEYIVNRAKTVGQVKVYPIGAITKGLKGETLAEMGDMQKSGIVAVSDDGKPVEDARLMRLAMEYASAFDLVLASHCEDLSLSRDGDMNEGFTSTLIGLGGIPGAAEQVMIARDCLLAASTGARVHICHVSTKLSVELIRWAKSMGIPVTCETAPHYLFGLDALCEGYDTHSKVNPPLRTDEDQQALIEGLKDGTIDCIATDHAPHHRDDKEVEYHLASSGISGFETAFGICYDVLVKGGHLTMSDLVKRMSTRPAQIFKLDAGEIKAGGAADLTLVDPSEFWTIDRETFLSKGHNTPFHGQSVTGRVKMTFVDGNIAYREDLG